MISVKLIEENTEEAQKNVFTLEMKKKTQTVQGLAVFNVSLSY